MKFLQILDLKASVISVYCFGIMSIPVNGIFWADVLKVVCAIVYLGYLIRRWYLMEKRVLKKDNYETED